MEAMIEKRGARPESKPRRAARETRNGSRKMIAEKRELRIWAPYACTALGWALTAMLAALMAAGTDVWVVFEVGFAAAVLFGIGIGWKIAEEVGCRDRR